MRFGAVLLPELAWAQAGPCWRRAEALGFEHAWTYDHLTWRTFRDRPWYPAIPTLTAAALATSRIRLGTLVASPNFRHPLPFVKELIALDDISAGRMIAGIGAGGEGWDATVLGHPAWSPKERAERFAEFVTLTDLLLRQPELTWKGRYYSVEEARTHPGCVQQPRVPLAIAATGPAGMRLAALHGDLWVTTGATSPGQVAPGEGPNLVRAQIQHLEDACGKVGRDPSTLRKLVLSGFAVDGGLSSLEAFRDTTGRYEEVGVTDFVVHWPRGSEPFAGKMARFEEIISATVPAPPPP
jgi:alkanesulfonate monooxygenase SsuD/methylene tetrahydromethanopterin reductase-like flavin-dependent oxidoreductase (luciferase family)